MPERDGHGLSQDELRSRFNDYLTGKRKVEPPPAASPPRKPRPARVPRPPKAVRPAAPAKNAEALPANLNPAQLAKLKIIKGSLPFPKYKRITQLAELGKDPAAFFARWDRLLNGFGMKGAAAVLLDETTTEQACVLRLTQLLRCDPAAAKKLVVAQQFASLPSERRAIPIRDRVLQLAKRWECSSESAARVVTGEMSESDLAVKVLASKLRIDDSAARTLIARREPGDPVPRTLELAQKIQLEAMSRQAALSLVVDGILGDIKAEEQLSRSVAQELSIPEDLATRLCDRPTLRPIPAVERGSRAAAEVRSLAAELGFSVEQACRFLCGELPAAEIDESVARAIATGLGLEPAAVLELSRHPDLKTAPVQQRAKKAVRRVQLAVENLRCTIAEAAGLLSGVAAPSLLASILRTRLTLGEDTVEHLVEWIRTQPGAPEDVITSAIERIEDTKASASCTADQAALIVCGRLTPADIRATEIARELAMSPALARKLVDWMEAEKVGERDAKARIRNLRTWAADSMDQACRMLLKEIPTPTKSDSDLVGYKGAWD